MQDKCGKLCAQRCAQGAWISTGGAGMDQLPVRGAKEEKEKGGGGGSFWLEKTEACLISFVGRRQFASKPLQARVDFCLALSNPGGLVIALVHQ